MVWACTDLFRSNLASILRQRLGIKAYGSLWVLLLTSLLCFQSSLSRGWPHEAHTRMLAIREFNAG